MELLIILLIGFLAGALAAWLMKSDYPFWLDIILGILGAFVGSYILSLFRVPVEGGLIWEILVAAFGAIVIIFVVRFLQGNAGNWRTPRSL